MKPPLMSSSHHTLLTPTLSPRLPNLSPPNSSEKSHLFFKPHTFLPISSSKHPHFLTLCISNSSIRAQDSSSSISEDIPNSQENDLKNELQFLQIENPKNLPPFVYSWRSKFSLSDRAFFLFAFIAFTTTAAFVSFVAAAVPTLYAMRRAANSFAKLADTAREELPGTMTAIRLSGMEVSDLTLELTDLSQEISEGVHKSAKAVQAGKIGIQQFGARAREQTISMIEENANLPAISLQPIVSGAAKKTSRAVGRATRIFLNLISGGESNSEEIS